MSQRVSLRPGPIALPEPQAFDSALDDEGETPTESPQPISNNPRPGRISFSTASLARGGGHTHHRPSTSGRFSFRRASRSSALGGGPGTEFHDEREDLKPQVPSLFTAGLLRKEPDATPLPILPMVVLGISMSSELLSSNVSSPFILAMVRSFGVAPLEVGSSTGVLVASFFVTQFFTSLLWASIADRYGRRVVIFTTLLGNAATTVLFGTAKSLPEAICIRLCQGIFNGGIGCVRGGIRDITDSTNEAKAYALLGFVWGFGGVIGPVLGGLAESPGKNYPGSAVDIPLFHSFPYLFPCLLASTILIVGAFLSLFLGYDGGPRDGGIVLPIEKDNGGEFIDTTTGGPEGLPRRLSKRIGGYFASRVGPIIGSSLSQRGSFGSTTTGTGAVALGGVSSPLTGDEGVGRTATQKRRAASSAYGYGLNTGGAGDSIRSRPRARSFATSYRNRRDSDTTARMERGDGGELIPDEEVFGTGVVGQLAERFLLANEGLGGNQINDLWVSQALAQDAESVFEDDESEGEYRDEEDEPEAQELPDDGTLHPFTPARQPRASTSSEQLSPSGHVAGLSSSSRRFSRAQLGVSETSNGLPSSFRVPSSGNRLSVSGAGGQRISRRFSGASARTPSIFGHTGLHTPPILSPSAGMGSPADPFTTHAAAPGGAASQGLDAPSGGLGAIREGAPVTTFPAASTTTAAAAAEDKPAVVSNPIWKLPLFLIFQYFALAVHDTTNGQLFLSFLNTEYGDGGLGLNPAHFSVLVAIMCGFQLTYQFYLYPRLGPPGGPFSHVQMFRLGSLLFIPAYLTTPILRTFGSSSEDGSPLLMILLVINMACRYAGGTFTYTAILILTNAMSPPEVVNLANGLAQSSVSAARVLGPLVGGALWTKSQELGVASFGFNIVAVGCATALASSFLLR